MQSLTVMLLRTVFPYSAPDYPTVLEVRVPIPQSLSASVIGCSPEDVMVPTTVTVSFSAVVGMQPCPDLSPNQLALRIARGTVTTLILEEDTTPLRRCPVFVPLTPLKTVPQVVNFQRDIAFRKAGE
ncbi:hypothetical protein TNCV_2930471 [Trichonephila clavipes]|nr:hypothetical protein TNCV_2930471 [Trichonephila clavipes]